MVSSTLRTLPKKSVIRTLPGLLRNRSVRWPGVDTHWLLGQTLNCEHKRQATTMTNLFKKTKLQSYLEIHNIGLKYCKNNEQLHRQVAFCQCITAGVLQIKKKPKSSITRSLLVGSWRLVKSLHMNSYSINSFPAPSFLTTSFLPPPHFEKFCCPSHTISSLHLFYCVNVCHILLSILRPSTISVHLFILLKWCILSIGRAGLNQLPASCNKQMAP